METTTIPYKRKNIDLNANTFRSLSVMAANRGTNLKRLIENILDHVAEDYDDNKAYEWLSKNHPEGHVFLDKKEQDDFENWLGV